MICGKRVTNSVNGGDRDLGLTFHLKYWRSWGSNKHPLGINLLIVATRVYRLGYYVELIKPELLKGHIQCKSNAFNLHENVIFVLGLAAL